MGLSHAGTEKRTSVPTYPRLPQKESSPLQVSTPGLVLY